MEFNAPVAHAGGSSDALNLAASTGMKDLNALIIGAPTFYRTNDRVAPHNLYTSSSLLDSLLAKHGYNTPTTFSPSPRQADHPTATPPHPNIHIDYSYNGYQVDYKYDPSTNDYARSLANQPHIDRNTGKQIHVKNIVVEMISASVIDDGHGHMQLGTTGRGQGWVIRDGGAIPCTWVKDNVGRISWYALGLPEPDALTCASRVYPRGSYLQVTNKYNGRVVVCRVNDYGPEAWTGRILDLSRGSFRQVDDLGRGVIIGEIRVASGPSGFSLPIYGDVFNAAVGYNLCRNEHGDQYCDAHRQE
jgi:hypothetical protein